MTPRVREILSWYGAHTRGQSNNDQTARAQMGTATGALASLANEQRSSKFDEESND